MDVGRLKLRQIRAILLLAEAYEECRDAGLDAWELAVPIADLIGRGVTLADIRVLHAYGYVDFRAELARGRDRRRRFKRCMVIRENTTVALIATDAAAAVSQNIRRLLARGNSFEVLQSELMSPKPSWDPEAGELRYLESIVKRLPRRADAQRMILDAFQECGWPPRVDDPLPPKPGIPPKRRLNNAIKKLNMHHKESILRFHGDGGGEGIRWEREDRSSHNRSNGPRKQDRPEF